jgi:DMSO/TMAO reductase YedYZ heme-binding membrane subunit
VNTHALWYLTRGTGLVALVLVSLSVIIGIASSLRAGGARTPRFVVAGLHRNVSLLLVAFIVIHVTTTILDAYAPIRLLDAVIPFVSAYRPIWLGLGALAFDLILALVITSLVRVRIGLKTWRGIHWFAYACFPIVVVHALGTGSDASQHWLLAIVIICVGAVVAAVLWRLWQIRSERTPLAVAGAAVAILAPLALIGWATSGPLAHGWAKRAGTPVRLLGGRASTGGASGATTSTKPPLPNPPYSGSLSGSISAGAVDSSGNTSITIDATTSGSVQARLKIVLDGQSDGNGGLNTLTSSAVTYGPASDPRLYTGTVIQLQGNQVSMSLSSSSTTPAKLLLNTNLSINFSGGTVTGTFQMS